jgi:hypothetical protein
MPIISQLPGMNTGSSVQVTDALNRLHSLVVNDLRNIVNAIKTLANSGSGSGARTTSWFNNVGRSAFDAATNTLNSILSIVQAQPAAKADLDEFMRLRQWIIDTMHVQNPVPVGVTNTDTRVALERLVGLVNDLHIIESRIRSLANSGSGSGSRVAAYIQGEGGQAVAVAINSFNALLPLLQGEPLAQPNVDEFMQTLAWINDVTHTVSTTTPPVTTPNVPAPPPPPPYTPPPPATPRPPQDRDEPVLPVDQPPPPPPTQTAGMGGMAGWIIGGVAVGLVLMNRPQPRRRS